MNEIAPISPTSNTPAAVAPEPLAATANRDEVANFDLILQNAPGVSAPYIRQSSAEPASVSQQMVNYVDSFDQRFHSVFSSSIESAGQLDLTDPMSMVHILEMQSSMFSVTMELELATKLADSGRHFATTLFNNQG